MALTCEGDSERSVAGPARALPEESSLQLQPATNSSVCRPLFSPNLLRANPQPQTYKTISSSVTPTSANLQKPQKLFRKTTTSVSDCCNTPKLLTLAPSLQHIITNLSTQFKGWYLLFWTNLLYCYQKSSHYSMKPWYWRVSARSYNP